MRTNLIASTAATTLLATTVFAAPPAYVVKDLGTLSGPDTRFEPGTASAALSSGAVVGHSVTTLPKRNFHGFRFIGNVLSDLGVLPDDEHSMAFSTNAAGDAVGVSYKLGELTVHGVLWPASGGIVSLGAMEPRDINDAGAIAASVPVGGAIGTTHAALVVGAVTTDLGTLGGPSSMAFALNAQNWVVGQSMLTDGKTTRGFLRANAAMVDLGTLGGVGSRALDIDGTNVVGIADTAAGVPHAALWTLTRVGAIASKTDLGTLAGSTTSAALGINANGAVVGTSGDRAFVWSAVTPMSDLNTQIATGTGWHLTRATSIDPDGRITGSGKHFGLQRGFLLTPRAPADLNADGAVDAADLAILLGAWGTNDAASDLTGDGIVDAADLAILLGAWG